MEVRTISDERSAAFIALGMTQHDQAVGLHHGAEHAGVLIAGDADLQLARRVGADDAALVFGASWLFAQGFQAAGIQQERRRIGATHQLQQSRPHKSQEGDHHRHRIGWQAKQHGLANATDGHGAARAHGNPPEGHIAQRGHHLLGVVGFAHAHTTAGDDDICSFCGFAESLF